MIRFETRSGIAIAADEAGRRGDPVVLFLHGGGQTRHSWGTAVATLATQGYHAITMDLRGHGESGWAEDGNYHLDELVDDLHDVMGQLPGKPALIGASMGGLTSLLTVGRAKEPPAWALVLVDVVPQIEPEGAQEIFAFMTANPDGFASLDDAANAIADYLPHRPRRAGEGLAKNLRLRDNGRYYWHWDPQMLSRRAGEGAHMMQAQLEGAAAGITVPTLLIRGGRSRIVSMDGVRAFQRLIPHSEFVNIEQADHMVAGDANDAFNGPLLSFLERAR